MSISVDDIVIPKRKLDLRLLERYESDLIVDIAMSKMREKFNFGHFKKIEPDYQADDLSFVDFKTTATQWLTTTTWDACEIKLSDFNGALYSKRFPCSSCLQTKNRLAVAIQAVNQNKPLSRDCYYV